jgi:hypothetical protein
METDVKPHVKMLTLGDFGLNRMDVFESLSFGMFSENLLCFDALDFLGLESFMDCKNNLDLK